MAQIQILPLDLLPAYIPFIAQCQDSAGAKTSPSVDNLVIYEEAGADGTPDSATITGSPFDPVQINSKTGLWGVWIAKSALTAGKIYIALWEMSIDGTTAAHVEMYFATNAASFKASGFSTHAAADVVTAMQAVASDFKADMATLEARLTAARAGYIDKLNVTGTIANSDAAAAYKADVSGIATTAELAAVEAHGDLSWATATGFSTFDPVTNQVDVGTVGGIVVSGPVDLKTDLSGVALETTLELVKIETDKFIGMTELDGGIYRLTANALEQAPSSSGATSGLYNIAIQIYETGTTTPIPDVSFAIRDSATSALITFGKTDNSGAINTSLDSGEYSVLLKLAGVSFTINSLSVSGDTSITFYGTKVIFDIPDASSAIEVWEICYDPSSQVPLGRVTATAKIVNLPFDYGGKLHSGQVIEPIYDSSSGLLVWHLPPGCKIHFKVDEIGINMVKYVNDLDGDGKVRLYSMV